MSLCVRSSRPQPIHRRHLGAEQALWFELVSHQKLFHHVGFYTLRFDRRGTHCESHVECAVMEKEEELSNLLQLRRSNKLYASQGTRSGICAGHVVSAQCLQVHADVPLLEWYDLIAQRAQQTQHLVLNIRRQSPGCKVVNRVSKIWRLGGRR